MLTRILLLSFVLLGSALAGAKEIVPPQETQYDLQVFFDLAQSKLMGRASLPIAADGPAVFRTGLLRINTVQLDGEPIPFASDAGRLTVRAADGGALAIFYEAVFEPEQRAHAAHALPPPDSITTQEIRLTGIWYPQLSHPATYRLTAQLPIDYEAVSEGEHAERHRRGAVADFVFSSSHPTDHITLIASNRYTVLREQVDGLELMGYFFREHEQHGRNSLAIAREAIGHYERRLTLFPHRRLSIVEVSRGGIDSRPRRIALGPNQLLPSTEARAALGRAIVRQWFGHLVYAAPSESNWSEGLATYLADHYGLERDRPNWEARRAYLYDLSPDEDHGVAVPPHQLSTSPDTTAALRLRARGAMVFHMLTGLLGEEPFFVSLRDLIAWKANRPTSWEDLQRVFDRHGEHDLSRFFDQWVRRGGVPELEVSNGAVRWDQERFDVRFDVSQKGEVFSFALPVRVRAVDGREETQQILVDRETQKIAVTVDQEPATLIVDPDYDLLRRLTEAERLASETGTKQGGAAAGGARGLTLVLRGTDTPAVDLSGLRSLSEVIAAAAGKKIVYVGEQHDQFAHHRVQLQVAEGLYRRHPKLAIGMEMFQRPSQQALDDYVAGLTTEKEFLKASEYFDRWGMNYNLYKPILDFARKHRLPVVALNTPRELTRKVGRQGLAALTDEEKKRIPQELDFSDNAYRARLKTVFDRHQQGSGNFEYFHQAQILWDETMAEGIDRFLRSNPDHQMLIVVGGGHLTFGSGIPSRAFRRNGYDYAVILNDTDVEPGIADYIVYPSPMQTVSAPKLMVMLSEEGDTVRISGFPEDSVSRDAGLRVGDLLTALDNVPVTSVADIKIALFYKNPEETVRVRVQRKRFLGTSRTVEFDVTLR